MFYTPMVFLEETLMLFAGCFFVAQAVLIHKKCI